MTPAELAQMTLADFEALAARMESAAKAYRDALAVFRGHPAPVAEPPPPHFVTGLQTLPQESAAEYYRRAPISVPFVRPVSPGSPVLMTPEREEYMKELRLDPQRAALLSQFARDGEPEADVPVTKVQLDAFGGGT